MRAVRAGLVAGLLAMGIAIVSALPVGAVPPIPTTVYGPVQVAGANVPDGTPVTAWIDGNLVSSGRTVTYNGSSVFVLNVPGDDADTPSLVEGGQPDQTVVFKIDGLLAVETTLWGAGAERVLSLSATPDYAPQCDSVHLATGTQSPTYMRSASATYSDRNGASDLAQVQFRQTPDGSSNPSTLAYYDQAENKVYLRDSDNKSWIGGYAPGTEVRLSNRDVTLDVANTVVSSGGSTLSVDWALVPHAASSGQTQTSSLSARDSAGQESGWSDRGSSRVNMFPGAGGVAPASGSSPLGGAQTFAAIYSDPDGAAQIWRGYILINSRLAATGGFYAYYDNTDRKVHLPSDDGTTWMSLTPGDSASIENSWVRIEGSGTSVARTLNALTVRYSVTFKAMSGSQNIWLCVYDSLRFADGWNLAGSWIVGTASALVAAETQGELTPDSGGVSPTTCDMVSSPDEQQSAVPGASAPRRQITVPIPGAASAAPRAVSITPSAGTQLPGYSTQFVTRFDNAGGWESISKAYFVINPTLPTAGGLYAMYDRVENRIFLKDLDDTSWIGGYAPGSDVRLSNGAVRLDLKGCHVDGSGTTMSITWDVTAYTSLSGQYHQTYGRAADAVGGDSGWVRLGYWRVNSAPSTGGATPASATAPVDMPASFRVTYSDLDGPDNLSKAYFLINSTLTTRNCFYGYYDRAANAFYLSSADNSKLLGPLTPGSGVLDNGAVALNGAGSSATVSGHTLTVTWNITFHTDMIGVKNLYAYVYDNLMFTDGWALMGTVTVASPSPVTAGADRTVTTLPVVAQVPASPLAKPDGAGIDPRDAR